MQYFQIGHETLVQALSEALSRGADYADIYLEHSRTISVGLQDAIVNRASSNIDSGLGVRAVKGAQTGYAYSEEISPEELKKAARRASEISATNIQAQVATLQEKKHSYQYYQPGSIDIEACEVSRLVEFLSQLRNYLLEKEPRFASVTAAIHHKTSQIAIANSLGDCIEEQRPMTSVVLSCVIKEGSRYESAQCSRSYRKSLDMLNQELLHTLADQCIEQAQTALKAIQPNGGEMPVVLGAGASGILLHEAIGHGFEADTVRRQESIYTDKLGKQICMPGIKIVDDGTLPEMRGSIHFDDEASPSSCTTLVDNGILTSFMHDRISAKHFGVAPTGNGRRESFRYPPIPRMRNTYMLGMEGTSEEDLIKSVKRGIFVNSFVNGQVQIGAGDFTFYVRSGYLIEDGHLTQPIKDINIIGNGMQTLADISGVANNSFVDPSTWMCGKEGQSCPVSCGMPSVLVKNLSVG